VTLGGDEMKHALQTTEIERIETRDAVDFRGPNWKHQAICYILTRLAKMSQGCIIAAQTESASDVIWLSSSEPCASLWPERIDGEILRHGPGYFRPLLGNLGIVLADALYWGGGTFKLRFEGERQESGVMGIIFGNKRPTGHWIKLFVLED
jgi:hypothetical protein